MHLLLKVWLCVVELTSLYSHEQLSRDILFLWGREGRYIFDPETRSPHNILWPWNIVWWRHFNFSISGVSLPRWCWCIKCQWALPRQAFTTRIAQNHRSFCFAFLFFLPTPHPLSFHPHSHHLPLGNESLDVGKDGWCCVELWRVSMQVIPLLFINNWPEPSVKAIYRGDFRFAKEHKLFGFHLAQLERWKNKAPTEGLVSMTLLMKHLTSGRFFFLPQNAGQMLHFAGDQYR